MKRVSVLLLAGILSFLATSCIEEQEAAFKIEEEAVLTKSSDATIPSVQAAVTSDSGLAGYRGIGALLTVKCPTSNAKSIKIVSRDNSARMTGTADAPANYVEATCQTTVVGNVYYFVIYPGSYSKGFDIIFTSKNDSKIKSIVSVDGAYSIECDTITDIFNSPAGYTFGWNTSAEPSSATAALTSTYGEAKISWTANASSSYANGYKVYARETGAADNGILKQTISSLATKECTIKGLATDKTYQFGVSTAATSGNKDSQITWASELYLPKPDSCATPSHLKVVQKSGTSVTLTWQDNSGIEAAYLAFKDDGTAVNSAERPAGTTTYTFNYLVPGNTYKFGVMAKGAYGNDSRLVYAPAYKMLSWHELQYADAGAAECVAPCNIKYNQETSTAVQFSWDCWSSANTGFNLYARPASAKEFTEEHLMKNIQDKAARSYLFSNLNTATEYVFGIQTAGNTPLENSDIIEIRHVVKNFAWPYPFESGRSIPTFSDLALCYGGNCERNPQYWTADRFKSTVTFTDSNNQEHWFFDAMLMLELWSNWNATSYALTADGHKSSKREHWQQQLDYWFSDTYGFAALDQCIEDAKGRIGAPAKKRVVIFSLPDPVYFENFKSKTNTKYWGSIAGTQMNFSTIAHRVEAYKWMINQVRALFNAKGYKNIELGGFYILNEALSVSSSSYNYKYKQHDKIIKEVAAYCRSINEGIYWIPYNCAEGYTSWKSLGITATMMQPNKYWVNETTKTWTNVLNACKTYGMGIELEFEGTHGDTPSARNKYTGSSILTYRADGSKNPYAAENKRLFRQYLSKIKNDNTLYKKKHIALYTGTNALYELANSKDKDDSDLYNELGWFIINAKH